MPSHAKTAMPDGSFGFSVPSQEKEVGVGLVIELLQGAADLGEVNAFALQP